MSRTSATVECLEPRRLLAGTASISGVVFFDGNRNGIREKGERAEWSAYVVIDSNLDGLQTSGEPVAETNFSGQFTFEGLDAGTHQVLLPWYLDRQIPTSPRGGKHRITVADGESFTGADFGSTRLGTISGRVVRNDPGNGTQWSGRIKDRVVYADIDRNKSFDRKIDRYTRTDNEGEFELDLYVGRYEVRAVLAAGEIQMIPRTTGFTSTGERLLLLMIAPPPVETFSGHVFDDLDLDGRPSAGDVFRPGVRVFIDRDNDQRYDKGEPQQKTDSMGKYRFGGLFPTQYAVNVVMPGARRTVSTSNTFYADVGGSYGADVVNFALTSTSRLFGSVRLASGFGSVLGMSLYIDLNTDGKRQADEPSDITSEDGEWSIVVPAAGTYTVRLVSRPGTTFTDPTTGIHKVSVGQAVTKQVPAFRVQT